MCFLCVAECERYLPSAFFDFLLGRYSPLPVGLGVVVIPFRVPDPIGRIAQKDSSSRISEEAPKKLSDDKDM
jgi:hypothetical protein